MWSGFFSRQHIGIFVVIAGTVCLAFSVRTWTQYSGDKYMEDIVERAEKNGAFVPTKTFIDRKLFWLGLAFVAFGSLLNW